MKYQLRFDHIELSEVDRDMVDEKIGRLDKLVRGTHMMDVTFQHSTHHLNGDVVTCIIALQEGKKVFHADRAANSVQTALDESLAAIEQELRHEWGKRQAKERRADRNI